MNDDRRNASQRKMTGRPAVQRAPGRPRNVAADRAILDAALDEYAERGYEGFCVDAVAARAGVAKATVYRRHCSKLALVMAAVDAFVVEESPSPDTGTLRGDLLQRVRSLRRLATGERGSVIRRLASDSGTFPEVAEAHRAFIATRRTEGRALVQQAVARGEIASTVDAELIADLTVGPVFYRAILTNEPISDSYLRNLVDAALRGFTITNP